MVDLFYRCRFHYGCSKLCSVWNRANSLALALIYPVYCRLVPLGERRTDRMTKEQVIVSLTSFPARIDKCHWCIESLLRQKVMPDKIILWLSEEQFPDRAVPESLKRLEGDVFSIRFCSDDLRPHKKSFYAFREYSDSIIITVDDDIIYPESRIGDLLSGYAAHPDCVSSSFVREIVLEEDNTPASYCEWHIGAVGKYGASHRFTAIGASGVLYPPHCFDEAYFDVEKIKALCLNTDDLWLKFNEARLGIKVNKLKKHTVMMTTILSSQRVSLKSVNVGRQGRNDESIRLLQQEFGTDWATLFAED